MNSFYNILAESLETKYKLNEAWGSAPDWMKPALMANTNAYSNDNVQLIKHLKKLYRNNKKYRSMVDDEASAYFHPKPESMDYDNAFKDFIQHYPDSSEAKKYYALKKNEYDYVNPRGAGLSTQDKSLYQSLRDRGIDITDPDIQFYEDTPPKSQKSNKADEKTMYACWAFSQYSTKLQKNVDYLYIKGINDYEKPVHLTDLTDDKLAQLPFQHWPLKALNENCTHFAYMDISQSIPIDFEAMKNARNQNSEDVFLAKLYGQERISDLDTMTYNNDTLFTDPYDPSFKQVGLDKSGYKQIPSSSKYAEQLKKLGAAKWANKLEECERELRKMQKDLAMAIQSKSFSTSMTDYGPALTEFDSARRFYIDMRQAVHTVLSSYKQNSVVEDKDKFVQALLDSTFDKNYKYFNQYASRFYTWVGDNEVLDF